MDGDGITQSSDDNILIDFVCVAHHDILLILVGLHQTLQAEQCCATIIAMMA